MYVDDVTVTVMYIYKGRGSDNSHNLVKITYGSPPTKKSNGYEIPRFMVPFPFLFDHQGAVSMVTCCCTLGKSWGGGGSGQTCTACPKPGSRAFRDLCPMGGGRDGSGEDFDECAVLGNLCGEHGKCVNTDGSYR